MAQLVDLFDGDRNFAIRPFYHSHSRIPDLLRSQIWCVTLTIRQCTRDVLLLAA